MVGGVAEAAAATSQLYPSKNVSGPQLSNLLLEHKTQSLLRYTAKLWGIAFHLREEKKKGSALFHVHLPSPANPVTQLNMESMYSDTKLQFS